MIRILLTYMTAEAQLCKCFLLQQAPFFFHNYCEIGCTTIHMKHSLLKRGKCCIILVAPHLWFAFPRQNLPGAYTMFFFSTFLFFQHYHYLSTSIPWCSFPVVCINSIGMLNILWCAAHSVIIVMYYYLIPYFNTAWKTWVNAQPKNTINRQATDAVLIAII